MSYYYYDNNGGRKGGFLSNVPQVTRNLILINIIVFVLSLIDQNRMIMTFALFYPTSQYFHPWQLITHMFMHGGFWHILFNMYSLYLFGSMVERMLGPKKFLVYYFTCGLGAVALHMGVQYLEATAWLASASAQAFDNYQMLKMTPTVGASGAIFGLLIAYAMMFPQQRLMLFFPPIEMSAKTMVIVFAVIELFTGMTGIGGNVAHFAHLGGMLFGFLVIKYWRKRGVLFDWDRW